MAESFDYLFEIGDLIELETEDVGGEKIALKTNVYVIHSATKFSLAAPLFQGSLYPIGIGKHIFVFFFKRDVGVFSFQALVVSRNPEDNLPAIQILRTSDVKKSQRRMYFRVAFLESVYIIMGVKKKELSEAEKQKIEKLKQKYANNPNIFIPEEEEQEELDIEKAEGRDLSGGGLRCISRKKFDVDSIVNGYIDLEGQRIEFKSKVSRCIENKVPYLHYEIGVMFIEMDEQIRAKLINYVFKKQRKIIQTK